jgi:hypothetical protein
MPGFAGHTVFARRVTAVTRLSAKKKILDEIS